MFATNISDPLLVRFELAWLTYILRPDSLATNCDYKRQELDTMNATNHYGKKKKRNKKKASAFTMFHDFAEADTTNAAANTNRQRTHRRSFSAGDGRNLIIS